MKRLYIYASVVCFTVSCLFDVANAQVVKIPDSNLAAAVRGKLGLGPNAAYHTAGAAQINRTDG